MSSSATLSPYEHGILRQAQTIQAVVEAGLDEGAKAFLASIPGRYQHVVMTGMGSGPWASYPAYLRLLRAGIPVTVIETAELITFARELLVPGTLLWVTSQSGESAEVVALLDSLPARRPDVLAIVNNLSSPLARAADVVIPLRVGGASESLAGTGTFANSVIVNALAADAILGQTESEAFEHAAAEVAGYAADWSDHVEMLEPLRIHEGGVVVLGRGPSLAAVRTGALLIKEAGKVHAEAMSMSEFRHGPIELVTDGFVAVLATSDAAADSSARLAADLERWGARVAWLGDGIEGAPGLRLRTPRLTGAARPIAELLPLQAFSVAAARAMGIEPGRFVNANRVTRVL
jgi:glucosamine--fructose-6-phosphate aminotransferase (isomerizing)